MFDFPWLELCWPAAPIIRGTTVAISVGYMGIWCLNACRIVYVIDGINESDGVSVFGFAYGTLPEHAESGEERFTIEFDQRSQSVTYDILAFSRPQQLLSKIGFPVMRMMQKKFAQDSMHAMQRAVGP
jgi:uncharacterized protein (UPF0548 family)